MNISLAQLNITDYYLGKDFKGKLDEVRIWQVYKTPAEIKAKMYDRLTGNENGLIAYHNFDDGSGSNWLSDFSPSANHGQLLNMDVQSDWVTSDINSSNSGTAVPPVTDFALNFDSQGQYLDCELKDYPFSRYDPFTIEMWIKPRQFKTEMSILEFPGFKFELRQDELYVGLKKSGNWNSGGWFETKGGQLQTNQWYYVTATFDGKFLKLYLNSIEVATVGSYFSPPNLEFGGSYREDLRFSGQVDRWYDGLLDEVRIWKKTARAPSEILLDMNNDPSIQMPNGSHHLQLNEGWGVEQFAPDCRLINMNIVSAWKASDR